MTVQNLLTKQVRLIASKPIDKQSMNPNRRSRGAGKRVRFGSCSIELYCHENVDADKLWYTRSELIDIAVDETRMIKQEKKYLEANKLQDPAARQQREDTVGWCWRGHENALHRYGKFSLRKRHCANVLRCHSGDRFDAIALADCSYNNSSGNGSILRARSLAIKDQTEAARIHKEATSIMRKSRSLPTDFVRSNQRWKLS